MAASGAGAPAKDEKKFQPDVLVSSFVNCKKYPADVPIPTFMTGIAELSKIVGTLGSAFSMASSDITEKLEVMEKRLAELNALAGADGPAGGTEGDVTPPYTKDGRVRATIQYCVLREVDLKLERHASGKYVSAARSLLRLTWFLDFLAILIKHLCEDTIELKEMARDAYDRALGIHHPWVVRTGIHAAIYFCPTKATFWKNLMAECVSSDLAHVKASLAAFLVDMEPVRVSLWTFWKLHKLEDLA